MFLKPFRVKTQTSMKGSGRKKLRADIGKAFPSLSAEDLNDIVPAKDDISTVKIQLSNGDTAVFYSLQKNPIFFDHRDRLFPTVYLLWRYPDLLPTFTTWPPVLSKMATGADLMLPGLYTGGQGVTPKTFAHIHKHDMCAVNLVTNRAAVVVGEAAMSGEDMYLSNMRGHGVHVLHVVGDHLWASGDMSDPPFLGDLRMGEGQDSEMTSLTHNPEAHSEEEEPEVEEEAEFPLPALEELRVAGDGQDSEAEEDAGQLMKQLPLKDGKAAAAAVAAEEQEVMNPIEEMDSRLVFCFKCALKARLKKSDLPLLTSTFFKNYMVPFCPNDKTIDVKKSSYKKLSKFLEEMQRQQFLVVKEVSKGVDHIISMDKSHQELRGFEVPEMGATDSGTSASNSEDFQPPQIVELFSINAAGLTLLKSLGFRKGDTMSAPELRTVLTDYIQANKLTEGASKGFVQLTPVLSDVVLNKNENMTHLKWEEVFSRFSAKLQPAYELRCQGKPPLVKKGSPTPIKITVQNRGGNKKVTLVENVDCFGIEPRALARTIQLAVQCSTTVGEKQEVVIQGNQVAVLADLLLDKYRIPRKFITGLEHAPKSKRR